MAAQPTPVASQPTTGPASRMDYEDEDTTRYVSLPFASLLRSEEPQDLANGLSQLSELTDQLEGEESWELCAELREHAFIATIGALVGHPEPAIHQPALLLLATLTTEDVDPMADETKRHIKREGIFELLVPHLFATVPLTVAFACAAVQNTVADFTLSKYLEEVGGVARLRELAHCDLPAIVQAAKACLHNMAESMDMSSLTINVINAIIKLQRRMRKAVRFSPPFNIFALCMQAPPTYE